MRRALVIGLLALCVLPAAAVAIGPGDRVTYVTGTTSRTGWLLVQTSAVDLIARGVTLPSTTQDAVNPSVVQPIATPTPTPSPTPTPTPTVTPSPTPTPTPTGFPDASNTGVPTGTALTPSTSLTINTAGAVIDGKDIVGPVTVDAPNVTIRNSRIRTADFWIVRNNSTGLLIEDSELDGADGNGTCVGSENFTVRRTNIHDCENGFDIGGPAAIEDNYVHDLDTDNAAHTDGIQIGKGAADISILHNTIRPQPVGTSPASTSCIIMWDEGDPQNTRVHIERNLLDGSSTSHTLYPPRQAASAIYINDNRMLPSVVWGSPSYWGYSVQIGFNVTEASGNVDDATGNPVPLE